MSTTAERIVENQIRTQPNLLRGVWDWFSGVNDPVLRKLNELSNDRDFSLDCIRARLMDYLRDYGWDDGETVHLGIGTSRYCMAALTCASRDSSSSSDAALYAMLGEGVQRVGPDYLAPIKIRFMNFEGIRAKVLEGKELEFAYFPEELILCDPYKPVQDEYSQTLTMDQIRDLDGLIATAKVYPVHEIVEKRIRPKFLGQVILLIGIYAERRSLEESTNTSYTNNYSV